MILDEIAAYLEAEGLGNVKTTGNDPTWPVLKGGLYPGTQTHPDDAIGVMEGVGDVPITTMGSTVGSVEAEKPGLVVHVRSSSYVTARVKAQAIWKRLHRLAADLSGVRYLLVLARESPRPIGRDDAGRWIVGCNYDVTKEVSP